MRGSKTSELGRTVGRNIRALRFLHRWKLLVIANRMNISVAALSKIETGVTDANLSRLAQIAHIFEVDVLNLFSEGNVMEPISLVPFNHLEKELKEKDMEIVSLQRKLIQLYNEIHDIKTRSD